MTDILFNEETHTYTVGGIDRPSVTQIIAPLVDFSFVNPELLAYKRDVGVAVHKAIELDIRGELDHASLAPPVSDFFAQWTRWKNLSEWAPTEAEVRLYSRLGYCGTADIIAIDGFGGTAIIDIKCTTSLPPTVGIQTAAYAQAYFEETKIRPRRFSLRLQPDGFWFEEHSDTNDFPVFLALLKVKQWAEKHGKEIKSYITNEVKQ